MRMSAIKESVQYTINKHPCRFLIFLVVILHLGAFLVSNAFFWLQLLHLVPSLESHRGNTSVDLGVHFVAGGLAGLTAASATYPLDLVRTRLAAQV